MERAVVAEDLGAVVVVGHDLGDDERDARIHRLPRPLVGVGLVQQLAVRVGDLQDRLGCVVDAHVGDRGHAAYVLQQRDRVSTERQARSVLVTWSLRVVAAVGVDVARLQAEVAHV